MRQAHWAVLGSLFLSLGMAGVSEAGENTSPQEHSQPGVISSHGTGTRVKMERREASENTFPEAQRATKSAQTGLSAPTEPRPPPAEAPQMTLETLRQSARAADAVRLHAVGSDRPDIRSIRERLEKLERVRAVARQTLYRGEVHDRLEARLITAQTHENFARSLTGLGEPSGLNGDQRMAWEGQKSIYRDLARMRAKAHLRSCVSLSDALKVRSASDKEVVKKCSSLLRELDGLPVGQEVRLPKNPRQLSALRSEELSVCVVEAAGRTGDSMPGEVLATLSLSRAGEVDHVSITGGELGSESLKSCLADALKLWAFPGLSNVTLEIPLQLSVSAI